MPKCKICGQPVVAGEVYHTDCIEAQMPYWRKVGEGEAPPDRFLGVSKWGHINLYERRCWGDKDWLVGGYYLPKDIKYWMPIPAPPGRERHE